MTTKICPDLVKLRELNQEIEDLQKTEGNSELIHKLAKEAAALMKKRCDRRLAPIEAAFDEAMRMAEELLNQTKVLGGITTPHMVYDNLTAAENELFEHLCTDGACLDQEAFEKLKGVPKEAFQNLIKKNKVAWDGKSYFVPTSEHIKWCKWCATLVIEE